MASGMPKKGLRGKKTGILGTKTGVRGRSPWNAKNGRHKPYYEALNPLMG
jgi:hypothetical protein